MGKEYAIRSDLHARVDVSREQVGVVVEKDYAGLFDLGDSEIMRIPKDHPVRQGQQSGEPLESVIVRNMQNSKGTSENVWFLREYVLNSVRSAMIDTKQIRRDGVFYNGVAGNTLETWSSIYAQLGLGGEQKCLAGLIGSFGLKIEASTDLFYDGEPVTYQDAKREGISPQSAVIYLPWKSSMNNVHRAVADAMEFDPDKYVVLSHDILTDECLPEELRDGAKTCKNEDQARYVLDVLSVASGHVIGFYGHIGFKYGRIENHFEYNGKEMHAYHPDSAAGEMMIIDL